MSNSYAVRCLIVMSYMNTLYANRSGDPFVWILTAFAKIKKPIIYDGNPTNIHSAWPHIMGLHTYLSLYTIIMTTLCIKCLPNNGKSVDIDPYVYYNDSPMLWSPETEKRRKLMARKFERNALHVGSVHYVAFVVARWSHYCILLVEYGWRAVCIPLFVVLWNSRG